MMLHPLYQLSMRIEQSQAAFLSLRSCVILPLYRLGPGSAWRSDMPAQRFPLAHPQGFCPMPIWQKTSSCERHPAH